MSRLPRRSKRAPSKTASSGWFFPAVWFVAFSLISAFCFWYAFDDSKSQRHMAAAFATDAEAPELVVTSNIQDVKVGDRVMGRNPLREEVDPTALEPDPQTWRKLVLQMRKESGLPLDITLLRPLEWIDATGAAPGGAFFLDLRKMGAYGYADVIAIKPCPPIPPGAGNVVTGTFHHEADPDSEILRLKFCNGAVIQGVTATHPFWSVDHGSYLAAGDLAQGDRVRTINGFTSVVAIELRSAQPGEMLYNLETFNEHVYQVTDSGILVHNACARGVMRNRLKRLGYNQRNTDRIMRAIDNGRQVVIIGENMDRVNAVARMVNQAGGRSVTYVPRKWSGDNRNAMEANRSWIRYWAKGKRAPVIDIGRQPTPRELGPSRFYGMENRSLHRWHIYTPFK